MRAAAAPGFTLLEVIIALTITGFILGGLFTLVAGSKQLSWRSEASLLRAVDARARINFSLLENEFSEVEPILRRDRYEVRTLPPSDPPLRKTQATVFTLQPFEIIDDDREDVIKGTRWLRLPLPE